MELEVKIMKPARHYRGSLNAPASKSYAQRAIAIASQTKGECLLFNLSDSRDVRAALALAASLGAVVKQQGMQTAINGTRQLNNSNLHAGEAGLSIRMFAPIAALYDEPIDINGCGTLLSRPLHLPEKVFEEHGVTIETNHGLLPVKIKGPMTGGTFRIDGSQSSQLLTGLLIALPLIKEDSTVIVQDLKSIPYIDMTMDVVRHFGVHIYQEYYKVFHVPGAQEYQPNNYQVEGDWSGAAFHLVAAAIGGEIELSGLNKHSAQADRAILQAIEAAGAHVSWKNDLLHVEKAQLNGFVFDATHCPDLFPPLANLAAQCNGESVIKGATRLIYKESNRATVIRDVWQRLGINVRLAGDEMFITGGAIRGGSVDSFQDHRIAMMEAVASIHASAPVIIRHPMAIEKSYPLFYNDFEKLSS